MFLNSYPPPVHNHSGNSPQNKPCQSKISSRCGLKVSLVVETMDDKENQRRVAVHDRLDRLQIFRDAWTSCIGECRTTCHESPSKAPRLNRLPGTRPQPRRATLSDTPRSSTPAHLFRASGTCSPSPTVCDWREGSYTGQLVSTLPCALGGCFFSPLASTRPRGSYLFSDPGFRRSHNCQTH